MSAHRHLAAHLHPISAISMKAVVSSSQAGYGKDLLLAS
jgi:hypothetical protein